MHIGDDQFRKGKPITMDLLRKLARGNALVGSGRTRARRNGNGDVVVDPAPVDTPPSSIVAKISSVCTGKLCYLARSAFATSRIRGTSDVSLPGDLVFSSYDDLLVVDAGGGGFAVDDIVTGTLVGLNADGRRVVFVGKSGGGIFPVDCTQTGGSAGTSSAVCSYVYTVKSKSGTTLATSVAPESSPARAFPMTVTTPAASGTTTGMAYYDSTGTLKLAYVHEAATVKVCT